MDDGRTISFADIGNETKGLVDPSIYEDTLQKDYLLPDSKKTKLARTGSLGPSGAEHPLQFSFSSQHFTGRKPGVISNNGIPILHKLR